MIGPADTAAGDRLDVVVLGSLNVDYVVHVAHRPAAGETVVGSDVELGPGGKGANQAVAVAHAGGSVAMVGAVGDDADGALVLDALARRGVRTEHVLRPASTRTGNAYIFLTPDGENTIVVASGANRRFDPERALAATAALAPRVVLLQGELPPETTSTLLAALAPLPVHLMLNLAPVVDGLDEVMRHVDTLVVNAGEAAVLLGREVADPAEATQALRRRPDQAVVITLGPDGAVGVDARGPVAVPAPVVEVVDTTGAGDTFAGVLALALARGAPLRAAMEQAVQAGARAVGYAGAQPPLP